MMNTAVHPIQSQYKFDSLSKLLNLEIIKEIGKFWEHILEYNYSKKVGKKVNKVLTLMVNSALIYSEDYDSPILLNVKVNTKTITIQLNTKINSEHYEFLSKIFDKLLHRQQLQETINLANAQYSNYKESISDLIRLGLDNNCKFDINYSKDNDLSFKSVIDI